MYLENNFVDIYEQFIGKKMDCFLIMQGGESMTEKEINKPFSEIIAERKEKWTEFIEKMSDIWIEKRWGEEYP